MSRLRPVTLLGWLLWLSAITAACSAPIRVEWTTETEMDTAGFNLYRSESPDGPFDVKVNPELIPASSDPLSGGRYSVLDRTARVGVTYYYQLEEVDRTGRVSLHGPIRTRAPLFNGLQALILAALAIVVLGLWVLGGRRSVSSSPAAQREHNNDRD